MVETRAWQRKHGACTVPTHLGEGYGEGVGAPRVRIARIWGMALEEVVYAFPQGWVFGVVLEV